MGITRKQARELIEQTRARGRCVTGDVLRAESKYRNQKIETEEGVFDSFLEYSRWRELIALQRAGKITGLRRQVKFSLDVNGLHVCDYIADAVYEEDGRIIVEDAKGVRTPAYRLKKRLMLAVHGIAITEYPPSSKGTLASRRKRKGKADGASNN